MLRSELSPQSPEPKLVTEVAEIIALIEAALEAGDSTDELMAQHNRLVMRNDIEPARYEKLYTSLSYEEAALEALMPVATKVDDITREELEEIARRIVSPAKHHETTYYLTLFEFNTPAGNSDLFYWPSED